MRNNFTEPSPTRLLMGLLLALFLTNHEEETANFHLH